MPQRACHLTKGLDPKVKLCSLQMMMAEILLRRNHKEQHQLGSPHEARHAWREIATTKLKTTTVFSKLDPDVTARVVGGERFFVAVKSWLAGMKWTLNGEVSNAELAIDFEVVTGLDLPGLKADRAAPLNERARTIGRILKTLELACRAADTEVPVPGKKKQVNSLNTVGGKGLMGFCCRPDFKGGEETMEVLEKQLPLARHWFTRDCWGEDIFPKYSAERSKRADKWPAAIPVDKQVQKEEVDPQNVPLGIELAPKGYASSTRKYLARSATANEL